MTFCGNDLSFFLRFIVDRLQSSLGNFKLIFVANSSLFVGHWNIEILTHLLIEYYSIRCLS